MSKPKPDLADTKRAVMLDALRGLLELMARAAMIRAAGTHSVSHGKRAASTGTTTRMSKGGKTK